jgi:uncharacterized caspase-like protein
MSRVLLVFAVFWLAGCHSSPRPQVDFTPLQVSRKVALVIGNTSYQELSSVAAASPDAYDVAAALRGLQFDVVDVKANLTSRELAEAIDTFCRRIQKGDLAVVYYSGHGGQAGGESYLVPVDYTAPPEDAQVEAHGAYPISRLRDRLESSPARVRVMIFDACRGAFLADSPAAKVGLLGIRSKPEGTIVAYSAPPGGITPFDQGRHGVYTAELLSMLRVPDRDLKEMLDEVQLRMYRLTKGRQMPFLEGTLEAPLYFGFVPEPTAGREERSSWASAEQADTAAGYQSYLQQFPKVAFVERGHNDEPE